MAKVTANTAERGDRMRFVARHASDDAACDVSVLIPILNEEDNVDPLCRELTEVLDDAGLDYEIIFVDDGSTDRSLERLLAFADGNPRILVLDLRRNFGQTAAMAAGIDHARGKILIPMDGDRQNDPHDIPALLEMLDGTPRLDIVSGWRKSRQDHWFSRRLPSKIANAMIRRFTGIRIHDFGCTLKAYRREVLEHISLSSDLHRFLPALAAWHGAKIGEMAVNHRPRVAGRTKYDLRRTIRVLLDLVTVKFLGSYMTKPLYFFGKLGAVSFALAMLLLVVSIAQKFGYMGQPDGLNLNRNVLVSLSALLAFCSVQCVLFGLVTELLTRMYHDIRGQQIYRVRRAFRDGAVVPRSHVSRATEGGDTLVATDSRVLRDGRPASDGDVAPGRMHQDVP